jgi:hypothetical protein
MEQEETDKLNLDDTDGVLLPVDEGECCRCLVE